jgi:septum formation protein
MIDKILSTYKVVLASASPRRREILSLLSIKSEIRVSDVAEPITDEDPALQAMKHARNKFLEISQNAGKDEFIIAADTIVVLDGRILGKPRDEAEAQEFLRALSGNTHTVISGICVGTCRNLQCAYESTVVQFARLSDAEIADYILTLEPLDKAGAYGIQGFGSQFITRLEGCYFNVMGFPVRKFYETLQSMKQEGSL